MIAYREEDYPMLLKQVAEASVRAVFDPITKGAITRYEVRGIGALNFLLEDVLEGGRSRTIAFEESGKVLSPLVRAIPIQVPAGYVGHGGQEVGA
ncbi:hypothetical protein ACFY20_44195 [Streptomyces sp. NPDC001312]|uniref:AtuA-related protein n=1 Tax=Streptomyces sp. NPDC001312 TaxID=3364561 RepID=UPI0036CCC10D